MTKTAAIQSLRALLDNQGVNTVEHLEQAVNLALCAHQSKLVEDPGKAEEMIGRFPRHGCDDNCASL